MKLAVVVGGVALLVAGALGALLFSTPNDAQPSSASTGAYLDAGSLSALDASIRRLSTQIDALVVQMTEHQHAELAAQSQVARTPEGPAVDEAIKEALLPLQHSIEELAAAVALIQVTTGDATLHGSELHEPVQPIAPQAFTELQALSEVDRDLRHHGWSMQQVLDRYGVPTRMAPSPGGVGEKLYYERPDGSEVIFWFINGRLAKVLE
jgi:hypothetical protein